MAPARGKEKLVAYVRHVQKKISEIEESGEPLPEEEASRVVGSVVTSVKSLCACAPAAVRGRIREAFASNNCLEGGGPNPGATLAELAPAMSAVAEILGLEEEEPVPEPNVLVPEPGEETETLVGVVNKLWEIEEPYRLKVGSEIELNVQRRADYGDAPEDRASEPLFSSVDAEKFRGLERAFVALLDNYIRQTNRREHTTEEEKQEMEHFIDLLSESAHMRYVHKVLVKWELAPESLAEFMAQVYEAWFTNYYGQSSSGFEHVFVGEERKSKKTGRPEVIGMHNWLQFYREEKKGNINYLGYKHKGPEDGCVISVTFAWDDDDTVKPVSTFLVGTSIAFDFALATLIFFGGKDGDNPWVKVGDQDVQIQLYKTKNRLGTFVRSVYID